MNDRPVELSRDTYRKIKTMSREQMTSFLADIYNTAYNEASASAVDLDELRAEIGEIKGIGEARLNEIMAVIERRLGSDGADEEDERQDE